MQLDIALKALFFGWLFFYRIQLNAHVTKQRGDPTKCNIVTAAGTVAMTGADMAAHHFRREKVAHAALNGLSLERIVIV